MTIDPNSINVILATDCGSTTTKSVFIERQPDGTFRQTQRGEAPTTVEEPFADVTIGVINAVTEIGEVAGRKLGDEDGRIIQPAGTDADGNPVGCDIYISTSSAGGGLQMMVGGVVKQMTAESAKRAALGAGAIVMDTIAANDGRKPHEQIQRIRELRPDMILLSGGTDGGDEKKVTEIAERIAPARPQPRFGSKFVMPVIFAGNKDARGSVDNAFDESIDLQCVDNLRPTLEEENLGPARDAIHDMFLEHVMAQAPGYDKLMGWTSAPIMPTPGAVGNILTTIAERQGKNALAVDIGGATTDVFSVFDGVFNRTVSANLGMSYSISNVVAEAGLDNVLRWVHLEGMDERELRNRVKNKMIRPTTIPQSREALVFEQAVAREALRLAYVQHKEFATTLKGVQQQRTVGDTFSQKTSGTTIVDAMKLDLLVASGGVLSHAPRMSQTALMLVDAFEPEGFTTLAKDSIFMMPHLGVLASVHPQASEQVFTRDCLVVLGTCVAAAGDVKWGKPAFSWEMRGSQNAEGDLLGGQLKLVELTPGETATVTVKPARGIDLGAGPGNPVAHEVTGGSVGLILDARGRPIALPESRDEARDVVEGWYRELNIIDEGDA